jgi:hypothetical protein
MKKRIAILIAAFIFTFTASYAKSSDTKVPESITSEFNSDFSQARNVQWEKIADYFKVSFNQNGVVLFAFYTEDADFMGIANNMLSNKLPASLQSEIKKNYKDYWVVDLFKYSIKDKPGYFIALENANQVIMLKSERNQNWYLYKTIVKS